MSKYMPDQGSGIYGYEVTYKSSLKQRFWYESSAERNKAFKKASGWGSGVKSKKKIGRLG